MPYLAKVFRLVHPRYKLGKRAPIIDPRTLKLKTYLDFKTLPDEPPVRYWGKNVSVWPMYLNDKLGCCVPAGGGHTVQDWTAAATTLFSPSDADILKVYEEAGGYNPNDPTTDQGMALLDMLNYWRKVGISGHKIDAFMQMGLPSDNLTVAPPPMSPAAVALWKQLRQVINIFGCAYVGVQLPLLAQNQVGTMWTVPSNGPVGDASPGSWGGHCVVLVDYNAYGVLCVTWGQLQLISWNWLFYYMDECWAVLSKDWMKPSKIAPSSFNWGQLEDDILHLQSKKLKKAA